MRLWSLHPKYLDRQGLVALWREALLARQVLKGETKGYRSHPQLERFRDDPSSLDCIEVYLYHVLQEARHRGYRFDASKVSESDAPTLQLPVTSGQLLYELEHLRRKLEQRSPDQWQRLEGIRMPEPHPMMHIVPGAIASWERLD